MSERFSESLVDGEQEREEIGLGAIIGGCMGGLGVILVAIAVWLYFRKRNSSKVYPEPPMTESEPEISEPELEAESEIQEVKEEPDVQEEAAVIVKEEPPRRVEKLVRCNTTPIEPGKGQKLSRADSRGRLRFMFW
jgi:hypothetical protein